MGTRGRESMASLMMPENPTEIIQRPDAPYDLADEEADEWRAIVNTMPADHFMRGNFPLLAQLCRHVVASRRVAQLIKLVCEAKPFCHRDYANLLTVQSAESSAIMRLSRSMRLTQQSVSRAETTKHPKNKLSRAPWDKHDED